MTDRLNVVDAHSNAPEHITSAATSLSKSDRRRKVFEAVYYHKKRVKTVAEIASASGLNRMQVLQAGGQLKKAGIVGQTKLDGDTAYSQIEFYQHYKVTILNLADKPHKIAEVVTKRNPANNSAERPVSFERKRTKTNRARQSPARKGAKLTGAKLRIAFLATNPSREASLRTDMEMRNLARALKGSPNRELVEARHIPAAEVDDLLDALNDFRPHIVHFAGHGGDSAVVFDNADADDDGGVDIDFALVRRLVCATSAPPRMLVFTACDTVDGADIFLESIPFVVAMSDNVADAAAVVFTTRFYLALVAGQPLSVAVEQGGLALEVMQLPDATLPTLLHADSVNAKTFTFI